MTDVLTLSSETARRLLGDSQRDLAAGVDLGPRQAQIACLSDSLSRSLHQLRETVVREVSQLPEDDTRALRLGEAAAGITLIARSVIGCASAYRPQPTV
jgi:hypothetical protein